MTKPANIKKKIKEAKDKLADLENQYYEEGCDCCEQIQYEMDELGFKIDELDSLLKKLLR